MTRRKFNHRLKNSRAVAHLMMRGIAPFQPLKNSQTVLGIGLTQVNALKASGQGAVLFQMIAEFLIGGGADAAYFATGQRRFEQIGGVHGAAGCGTGPHYGMDFVDKQNGLGHALESLHNSLEASLEVATVAGAGQQQPHIQSEQPGIGKHFRRPSLGNAQSQTFGKSGFAHARIAHEKRIILAATAEYLNGAIQLLLTAHKGVNLAFPGARRKIHGILSQRIPLARPGCR